VTPKEDRVFHLKAVVKSHPLASFLLMTFACSWSLWGAIYVLDLSGAPGYMLFLLGASSPSLMAFATSAVIGGRQETRALWQRITLWRVGLTWLLVALLLPAIIVLCALGIYRVTGGVIPAFSSLIGSWYLLPIAFAISFLLGGPLQEEFGWRGFAVARLQRRHNALVASLIVGILWGVWHLPTFLIPWSSQHGLPLALFLLHDVALSVVITWIFNNTGGSVLLAMLAHAAFNLTITALPILPSLAGSELPLAYAVALLYAAAILVTLTFGARTLTREEPDQEAA
jgi:membrane protease YdiL (CAAX protease family)